MELIHEKFGTIRAIEKDGTYWFCAKDICDALDYEDHKVALRKLDDDEKGAYILPSLGGPQEMLTVNESGLYALILRSNKPRAREFRKWVTNEVLPTLRRTGRYEMRRSYANDDPPLQYYYDVLCARVNWLVDIGVITWPYYNKLSQTGRLWRVRRGGPGQYAMVAVISLPPAMRQKTLAEAANYFGHSPDDMQRIELIREPLKLF
ncbi:MAG TPA: BRO family protein [Bacteroidales bacterium]